MKKITRKSLLIFALGLTMLSACGGGGGGGSSAPQTSGATTAVLKILTTGTLGPGTLISGVTVTAVLPAGVTVRATPDSLNPSVLVTDSGVVIATGVTGTNAATLATYNSVDRKVGVMVYDYVVGFGTGEFVTVNCDIAAGASPTAAGFVLTGYVAKDLNGVDISGVTTPGFTVDIH